MFANQDQFVVYQVEKSFRSARSFISPLRSSPLDKSNHREISLLECRTNANIRFELLLSLVERTTSTAGLSFLCVWCLSDRCVRWLFVGQWLSPKCLSKFANDAAHWTVSWSICGDWWHSKVSQPPTSLDTLFPLPMISSIMQVLNNGSVGFQVQYQLIFCLWVLTFNPNIATNMSKYWRANDELTICTRDFS